jgi:hypothetical protein
MKTYLVLLYQNIVSTYIFVSDHPLALRFLGQCYQVSHEPGSIDFKQSMKLKFCFTISFVMLRSLKLHPRYTRFNTYLCKATFVTKRHVCYVNMVFILLSWFSKTNRLVKSWLTFQVKAYF